MQRHIFITLLCTLGLALATPALADRDHKHGPRWQERGGHDYPGHDRRHDSRKHGDRHKPKHVQRDRYVSERRITVIRDVPRHAPPRRVERHDDYRGYRDSHRSRNVPLVSIGGVPVVTVKVD